MSVAPEEIRDVTSLTTVHDRRAEDGSSQRSTDSRNGISLGVILVRSMSCRCWLQFAISKTSIST